MTKRRNPGKNERDRAPEPSDRLAAQLALQSRRDSPAEDCPTDETLALFIDGLLTGRERERLIAHLDTCSDCYRHWVESAELLRAEPPPVPARTARARIGDAVGRWLSGWRPLIPLAAATAAALAMVVLWRPADFTSPVDQAYADLVASEFDLSASLQALPAPWEDAPWAFGDTPVSAPGEAFIAGVWWVRSRLETVAPDPALAGILDAYHRAEASGAGRDLAAFYEFGRWTITAWAAFQRPLAAGELARHVDAVDMLAAQFASQGASSPQDQRALEALTRIRASLQAAGQPPTAEAREALARELMLTMQRLAL